ncbi:hypothetical protein PsYK624_095580 [Phanerochaete sordida]|uniref:Uncharacterized protein n=1 Tax=Phanerochaete sordida TaxID=48140 RepID=A0A9P3LG87_9APHY|nr:hypothetical protein PsYK624_095580 [Phanerochaete sordida]
MRIKGTIWISTSMMSVSHVATVCPSFRHPVGTATVTYGCAIVWWTGNVNLAARFWALNPPSVTVRGGLRHMLKAGLSMLS